MGKVIKSDGYPASADKSQIRYPMVMLILTALVTLVARAYAPIAAISFVVAFVFLPETKDRSIED